jgi:6-phosphofructokinase 1
VAGDIDPMTWDSVNGWSSEGGAKLRALKTLPEKKYEEIAFQFRKHNVQALLIVGGFTAFQTVLMLEENRNKYPEFQVLHLWIRHGS